MKRLEKLRAAALSHIHNRDEFYYRFYKRYSENCNSAEYPRYTDAFYYALSELTPDISDGELIVGKTSDALTDAERSEWQGAYKRMAAERCTAAGEGQDSHMAIDYELVLSKGLYGVISRIEEYEKSCADGQREFYTSAKKCLLAVIKHSEEYAEKAAYLAENEIEIERKSELLRIARICKKGSGLPCGKLLRGGAVGTLYNLLRLLESLQILGAAVSAWTPRQIPLSVF